MLKQFLFQIWGDLVRIKKPDEERPELLVSMNYLPQAERFTVVIMKAKNLDTEQDPYVKVTILKFLKRNFIHLHFANSCT